MLHHRAFAGTVSSPLLRRPIVAMLSLLVLCAPMLSVAGTPSVLMFVPQEDTYYSEYIVMRRALEAAGYTVDVRSATGSPVSTYLFTGGIVESANSLTTGTYTEFTAQFAAAYGVDWDAADNAIPSSIAVEGALTDVLSMEAYEALVVVGGTGAIDYRIDGSYGAQGVATAQQVEDTALQLNALALDALTDDKPVMGQCHGAGVPVFWRIPGTSGPGAEALGFSLLKDSKATGFPEPETSTYMSDLDVTLHADDRVTIGNPHPSFYSLPGVSVGDGAYRVVTTRDWYPQTIVHAAETLLNMLRTYPSAAERVAPVSVLIIHGGAVDPGDCSAGNRDNDIPCNFGTAPENLPADFTDLVALLQADSAADDFTFNVTDVDLYGMTLPFDPNDVTSVGNYLATFDAVLFYKHWSNEVTQALKDAIVDYTDAGGTLVGLHHAAYNDVLPGFDKDELVELFGVESLSSTWMGSSIQQQTISLTQHGHFISSFGVDLLEPPVADTALPAGANTSSSLVPAIDVEDEIYHNFAMLPSATFGRTLGDVQPLLSNDGMPASQADFMGLTRVIDPTMDASRGKVVYLMAGERPDSYAVSHPYGQMIRNAVAWSQAEPWVYTGAQNPPPPPDTSSLTHLNDEFDDPMTLGSWPRLYSTENWATDPLLDFSIDSGAMWMSPSSRTWWEDRIAALAFHSVSDDFVITTEVEISGTFDTDPFSTYSLAGLTARMPQVDGYDGPMDFAAGQQNYVNLLLGFTVSAEGPRVLYNHTQSSVSTNPTTAVSSYRGQLRLARIEDYFVTLFRPDGEAWQVGEVISWPGAASTLQVGLNAAGDFAGALSVAPAEHNNTAPTVNPGMTARFEFVRYQRPDVPTELVGTNLQAADPADLLGFLGFDSVPAAIPDVLHSDGFEAL